jgi:hypothetical protein
MPANGRQSDSNIQRARLNFFLQDRLIPVLGRLEQSYSPDFVSAELLESFFWLHHGLDIGYFPLPDARLVMYEYFRHFLRARDKVYSGPYLETWFVAPLRAILDGEFSGRRELFSSEQSLETYLAPSDIHPLFQSFLVSANGFAENETARPFVQALATVDDLTWQNVITNNELVLSVERPAFEPLQDVATPNWTHSGFFASVEYMRAFRKLNADAQQGFPPSVRELSQYLRILREAQQWRLNFGYPRERERFIQAGRIAAETYIQNLPTQDKFDTINAIQTFLKELRDLMTDWGAPIVKAAGA